MLLKRPEYYRVLLLLTVFLIVTFPLRAQETNVPRTRTFSGLVSPAIPYVQPEEVGLSREKLDWLGDEIASWVASGELVGAELLIVKDEKTVFHEAYGWSNRERGLPVERNSIWSIKSMSKPFTATAILMLAEDDALSLDDPVSQFLPGFAGNQQATVRHLLSHTSGYREEIGDPRPDHGSLEEWVEDWASKKPAGSFGVFNYSDFNYAALGYIVGKVSGTPIDVFVEERIIGPLGLVDTSTGFSSDPAWRARINPWYRWNERGGAYDLRWTTESPGWAFYPAAWGMFSTAMDYAVFMATWMNQGAWKDTRLLSKQIVNEALQPRGKSGESSAYGYGWYLDDIEGVTMRPFGHGGGDGTQSWAFPADDAIVIFLTHSRWGPHSDAFWNRVGMSGLLKHYPGFGLDWEPMAWASEAEVLETELSGAQRAGYVGAYQSEKQDDDAFEVYRVWEEDDRLNIGMGRPGSKAEKRFHLVPLDKDRFLLGRYGKSGPQAVDRNYKIHFLVRDGVTKALELLKDDKLLDTARRLE